MSRERGVPAARNGPSLPPCMAKAEMSTADRLGSRQRSSRAGWRELLTPWVDERGRSLSHRGAVSFKTNFSPVLDGRAVGKSRFYLRKFSAPCAHLVEFASTFG